MGVANEILQIDAGWSKIETVIAARKIKIAKRIMSKEPSALARRTMEKAIEIRTEWTRETEGILKDRIPNLAMQSWKRVNQIVKRIKHDDLLQQLERLKTECSTTAQEYVDASKKQHVILRPETKDYLIYNGHRRQEIQQITKLRAKASQLRSDLNLRHLLPPNTTTGGRYCGLHEEIAEHVLNEC